MEGLLNQNESSLIAQKIIWRLEEMLPNCVEQLKPKIFPDGNQWCCLYGDNLQEGICGYGDTPALAVENFNQNYYNQKLSK